MPETSFTLPAYAKINLSLRVLGRRADAFHELETVFQTITLCDRLTFQPLPEGRFELACDAADIPTDESNLVSRAAKALREQYFTVSGARVELSKRIPSGAGLGGGSSDAAVALVGLARLWEIETDARELARIGARLGADVPFFLTGGTALGTGLGTEITPLADAASKHLLVVTPGVKVSTAEAYGALDAPALTKSVSIVNLPISRADAQISDSIYEVMRNDFEPIIFRLYPEIERARSALLASGARKAMLAGSGSSVFGLFDTREEQERAGAALRREAGWQLFACQTLTRADYLDAFGARGATL